MEKKKKTAKVIVKVQLRVTAPLECGDDQGCQQLEECQGGGGSWRASLPQE